MGTAVLPAKTSSCPWDAFANVNVFVDTVLAELETMAKDGARPLRSEPKPPLAGAALRKAVMAIWCVCFCGMQWRAIGLLCTIPFGTLYALFAPLDSARPLAPAARPAAPNLAACLRGFSGTKRRSHRQPILPLGAELL
jgi:hypothetical protein